MLRMKTIVFGVIFFFTSSFISYSAYQQGILFEPKPPSSSDISAGRFEKKGLPDANDNDFIKSVLEEAAKILGWRDCFFRSSKSLSGSVNPETGMEDFDDPNGLSVSLNIEPMSDIYGPISPDQPNTITFHGYTAYYGSSMQDWEVSLIWNMEGYHFWVYGAYQNKNMSNPNVYPYGEALYEAFWNVVEGKTGESVPPPAPQDPPSEPGNQPGDLCANVTCQTNYCKDDGSKFLYDCACDPNDGKCYCSGLDCPLGCDDLLRGCIQQQAGDPNDLCYGVDCGPDYCLDDQKTRMHDCKCDKEDGNCYCYSEVCDAGCNMATGKCVESMVIVDDPADANNGPNGDLADNSGPDSDTGSSGGGYIPPAPDGPGLLGVVGGVAAGGGVLAGAGYLGYKAVQAALARQAAKAAAKAAAQAAEPSLSELLARAERSADRASEAIDQAIKGTAKDARNYREFLERTTAQNEAWSKTMAERAKNIEWAEKGVKYVKKGADVTADLLGNVPGVGTTFKYTYNLSTTAAESIAGGDSVGTVALKTVEKGMETMAGDVLFGKVTSLENLPTRMSMRTIKIATRQVGPHYLFAEGVKNEATNATMNWLKAKKSATWFGKVEKGLAKAGKKIDTKFIGKTIKKVFY